MPEKGGKGSVRSPRRLNRGSAVILGGRLRLTVYSPNLLKRLSEKGTSNALIMDLASIRRAKWIKCPSLADRRATLRARPRLFGQSQKKNSANFACADFCEVDCIKQLFLAEVQHGPAPISGG